jgi:hypothetical protein
MAQNTKEIHSSLAPVLCFRQTLVTAHGMQMSAAFQVTSYRL